VRVALLGGTGEASELAQRLVSLPEMTVDVSLARDGGFGGVDGLAAHLRSGGYDALVDATHPFATTITAHAIAAAAATGVPLVVLRRPGWTAGDGDEWRRVPDFAAAASRLAALPGQTVFAAIGRTELAAFRAIEQHQFVLRMIETPPPELALPLRHHLVLQRGPFDLEAERELLSTHRVELVVTKDSGGSGAAAKLVAARERGLPVIMIDRPASPVPDRVRIVETVPAALGWLVRTAS
jgi:precorrin-6A/cobalt-precorrin-6A reductase